MPLTVCLNVFCRLLRPVLQDHREQQGRTQPLSSLLGFSEATCMLEQAGAAGARFGG
jgi:hypothetical protein